VKIIAYISHLENLCGFCFVLGKSWKKTWISFPHLEKTKKKLETMKISEKNHGRSSQNHRKSGNHGIFFPHDIHQRGHLIRLRQPLQFLQIRPGRAILPLGI
jgi:hypothetical protein